MTDGPRRDPAGAAFTAGPSAVRAGVDSAVGVEAFVRDVYDSCQRDLHTFARSLVREPEAAEDLVADAFVRLIREIRADRAPDRPRAWLFRVVANLAVNHRRRRSVAMRVLGRLVQRGDAEPADERLLRREADLVLRDALLALPVSVRTALLLAAEGFSGREIATAIGRSEAATRTLLSRGRVRLREQLTAREAAR